MKAAALNPAVLTPLIIACALFMENLDGTILATALPSIAAELHEDPITLKLALTSYYLALAVFVPASGWAADRFGAKNVFRGAILVFTLGSICCGLSDSLAEFVGARVIQGCGGAMMMPVGRLVLLRTVERSELVRALAFLTTPALLGPVLGPPVGGFITTYYHWRWVFWINVPIGAVGIVLATLYIADVRAEERWPLDVRGFFLSGIGLSAFISGLTIAGRGLVSPLANGALIAAGVVSMLLYVRHARKTAHPIIDLRLLALPTFRASISGGLLFRTGSSAMPFLLPLLLQVGFGLSAFQSGSLTFVSAAGALLMKPTAGPVLRRFGFRSVLLWNGWISAALLAVCGLFTAVTPVAVIMTLLLLGGFTRSLQFTSINALAYADVDNAAMSRATSFSAVVQQLSQTLGVAVAAASVEISRSVRGEQAITSDDFVAAFLVIAILAASSMLAFYRLPADAGAVLSGRRAP